MKRVSLVIGASAGLLLFGLNGCGGSDIAPQPPDLSGSWELNASQSDVPPGETQDVMIDPPRPPRGSPPGGAGGPPGGRRGPGAPGRGGFNPAEMRERLREMMAASRQLTIRQTDSTLTVKGKTGPTRILFTDGREKKKEINGVGHVQTKTRWKDGTLVVEQKFDNGLRLRETFERSQDGQRLSVLLELEGSRLPRELRSRRVYDRVSEGAPES